MALKRPFSELDWQLTPEPVRQYIMALERMLHDMQQRVQAHEKRIEKLEIQTSKNSHNSSKPPSSDPPFSKKKRKQAHEQKAARRATRRTSNKCWTRPRAIGVHHSVAHAGIRSSIRERCNRFTYISISNFPKSTCKSATIFSSNAIAPTAVIR